MPRLEILAFHRILSSVERYFIPPMSLERKSFVRLIEKLSNGYRILHLHEAVSLLKNRTLPARSLCLTFDDGYIDNFELAGDFLSAKGIPATFFLPLNQIDSGKPYWWDYVYWITRRFPNDFPGWIQSMSDTFQCAPQPPQPQTSRLGSPESARSLVRRLNETSRKQRGAFLNSLEMQFGAYQGPRLLMEWEEARALIRAGFSIGSHSLSHEPLTDLDTREAVAEIKRSRLALAERLGSPVSGFCYPRGAHSTSFAATVEESGYSYAVTTRYGSNPSDANAFMLFRRNIADYTGWHRRFPVAFQRIEISGALDLFLSRRRSP